MSEGVANLIEDGAEVPIGTVDEPDGKRVERVAQNPREHHQLDGSTGLSASVGDDVLNPAAKVRPVPWTVICVVKRNKIPPVV